MYDAQTEGRIIYVDKACNRQTFKNKLQETLHIFLPKNEFPELKLKETTKKLPILKWALPLNIVTHSSGEGSTMSKVSA